MANCLEFNLKIHISDDLDQVVQAHTAAAARRDRLVVLQDLHVLLGMYRKFEIN